MQRRRHRGLRDDGVELGDSDGDGDWDGDSDCDGDRDCGDRNGGDDDGHGVGWRDDGDDDGDDGDDDGYNRDVRLGHDR